MAHDIRELVEEHLEIYMSLEDCPISDCYEINNINVSGDRLDVFYVKNDPDYPSYLQEFSVSIESLAKMKLEREALEILREEEHRKTKAANQLARYNECLAFVARYEKENANE